MYLTKYSLYSVQNKFGMNLGFSSQLEKVRCVFDSNAVSKCHYLWVFIHCKLKLYISLSFARPDDSQ